MLKNWIYFCAVSSVVHAEVIEYHAHPKYSFEYGVNDPGTQDVKKHWETRDGDKVDGSYSIKEADGTVRIVEYHANDRTGFNAVVRREGHAIHPPTHNHVPSQTFMNSVMHRPIDTIVHIPSHTIVETSVKHIPKDSLLHTPIPTSVHSFVSTSVNNHNPVETVLHTPVQDRVHSFISTSVSHHNPMETLQHTPVQVENPVHTLGGVSVSGHHPVEASAHSVFHTATQNPLKSEVRYFVRTPVHILEETPLYGSGIHSSAKTPEYTIIHNSKKVSLGTSIHKPVETSVKGPIENVHVQPQVTVDQHIRTATASIPHEKEPEVYKSQIAGTHSASFI